jgi:hypothetical protein
MKILKNGSIVFTMVITISLLTMVIYCLLRSNHYYASLAYEREKYEKHYQLAYSLYVFVKNQHKEKFEKFDKKAFVNGEIIYQSAWPDVSSKYVGKVWIDEVKESSCVVCVDISKGRKSVFFLKIPCSLQNEQVL